MKPLRRFSSDRKGSLLLLMLLAVTVSGFIAARLIPSATAQRQRQDEEALRDQLALLRQAVASERVASSSSRYHADWSSRTVFLGYLDDLVRGSLLSRLPRDPSIPDSRWGTDPARAFWLPTLNFVSSASFEATVLTATPWATGSINLVATFSRAHWAGRGDAELDSFPGENVFGSILGTDGGSLLIVQP